MKNEQSSIVFRVPDFVDAETLQRPVKGNANE